MSITYPAGSVYGDGIPRPVRTIYGKPLTNPDGTPVLDTLGPFVGHDAYGVPVFETVAEWEDSSGYYRITVDTARTELHTHYAPNDDDPATVGLFPAPDYVPVEPWSPFGYPEDVLAQSFAIDDDGSCAPHFLIGGVWYLAR